MEKKMATIELVLSAGGVIIVNFPENISYKIWEEIKVCLDYNKVWFCGDWIDLEVTYGNQPLNSVDFKKVIGING